MRKFLSNIVRSIKEVTLPLWAGVRGKRVHEPLSGRGDGIVVSLTSFPARIKGVRIVLDSLFRQTMRPDRIVLVLTEEEFPGGLADLPPQLTAYLGLGVEIIFLPYNHRCHNKYLYSLKEFPDATVITVDDDCYYRSDTIARLMELHGGYPGAVCCNIAAVIDPDHFHEYSCWKKSSSALAPGSRNVALGFAGILYPPGMASVPHLLDAGLSSRLSPTADDLWLKACEMSAGIDVACGGFFPKPVTIKRAQRVSLRSINKGAVNRNDVQWKALDGYFGLKERL